MGAEAPAVETDERRNEEHRFIAALSGHGRASKTGSRSARAESRSARADAGRHPGECRSAVVGRGRRLRPSRATPASHLDLPSSKRSPGSLELRATNSRKWPRKTRVSIPSVPDHTSKGLDAIVERIQFLVAGHTHHAKAHRRSAGDGRGVYLNSGTWIQLVRLSGTALDEKNWPRVWEILKEGDLSSIESCEIDLLVRPRNIVKIEATPTGASGSIHTVHGKDPTSRSPRSNTHAPFQSRAQWHPIRSVTLEIIRHGPPHNQLLSPLTQYIALSDGFEPTTLNIPVRASSLPAGSSVSSLHRPAGYGCTGIDCRGHEQHICRRAGPHRWPHAPFRCEGHPQRIFDSYSPRRSSRCFLSSSPRRRQVFLVKGNRSRCSWRGPWPSPAGPGSPGRRRPLPA